MPTITGTIHDEGREVHFVLDPVNSPTLWGGTEEHRRSVAHLVEGMLVGLAESTDYYRQHEQAAEAERVAAELAAEGVPLPAEDESPEQADEAPAEEPVDPARVALMAELTDGFARLHWGGAIHELDAGQQSAARGMAAHMVDNTPALLRVAREPNGGLN